MPLLTEALGLAYSSPCSNDIRLGIAACYMKLGELDLARLTYERVLAVDGTCARGYMGLAAVGLIGSTDSGLGRCLEFLQQAHKLDPYLPQLNSVLSQLALVKGDSQTALDHAKLAVSGCCRPNCKARNPRTCLVNRLPITYRPLPYSQGNRGVLVAFLTHPRAGGTCDRTSDKSIFALHACPRNACIRNAFRRCDRRILQEHRGPRISSGSLRDGPDAHSQGMPELPPM